jgi:hypothetical protein
VSNVGAEDPQWYKNAPEGLQEVCRPGGGSLDVGVIAPNRLQRLGSVRVAEHLEPKRPPHIGMGGVGGLATIDEQGWLSPVEVFC